VVPVASLAAEAASVDLPPAAEAPVPPLPTLDDVASLVPGEEISRFVARGVDENVKRAAIRKLFTDPHYNVMDGLDIYIDDYSLPDPIPMAMLRQMNQSKFLGLFEKEEAEEAAAAARDNLPPEALAESLTAAPAEAPTESPAQDAGPAHAAAVPQTPDEDADLQLQPDDDARRPGAATRAGLGRA
jgi:hypothetical protein